MALQADVAAPCARPASWRSGPAALDHHVERLADDHENARVLAEGWRDRRRRLDPSVVETNIVVFGVRDAAAFCATLDREGVKMYAIGPQRVRAVTHLDVDRAGIERAIAAARTALA